MRLAGTCSRYSKSAIPQLTSAATYHGLARRFLRCAYQANVMNTFEHVSSTIVVSAILIGEDVTKAAAPERRIAAAPWHRPPSGTSVGRRIRASPAAGATTGCRG